MLLGAELDATLAGVLSFWGKSTDPRQLRQEMYLAKLHGTLPMDLVLSAQHHGLKAEMIRGDWVKPGAAVVDVGINRTDAGLVGDVAQDEAREVAGWISPVPGGVGLMTRAFLLVNTLEAAERRLAARAAA